MESSPSHCFYNHNNMTALQTRSLICKITPVSCCTAGSSLLTLTNWLTSHSQPIEVRVKTELPACVSTSAAGSQDQPEAQWADREGQSSPPPPRHREACTWVCGCHSNPAGLTQHKAQRRRDTLQHRAHQVAHSAPVFWIFYSLALLGAQLLQVEVGTCCTPRRDSRVSIWH